MNELQLADKKEVTRPIETITAEIKDICRQAQIMALHYAVEIGRRLVEAKEAVPYGEWGNYLKNEVEFSQSSANNFMKLFEEYGSQQISIYGASVDSQSFANLPYSKALKLLAIPYEEREAFAEEVGADELSVKELEKAIAERDKAKKEAEELKEKIAELENAKSEVSDRSEEVEMLRVEIESAKKEAEDSKKHAERMKEELEKALKNPQIPKDKLAEIKKQAEESAKNDNKKKLDELEKRLKDAEAAEIKAKLNEKVAAERLEEANKKLKTSDSEVTAFKVLFDEVQGTVKKLHSIIEKIREESPETADKLSAALKAFGAKL